MDILTTKPVRPTVIALLALASAPWSLRWLASIVESLKVGDVTLNFREEVTRKLEEQQNKLEEQQRLIGSVAEVGVGGNSTAVDVAGPLAHGSETYAPDRDAVESDETRAPGAEMPGKPVVDGLRLSARVEPFPGSTSLFVIHASVVSVDSGKPLMDGTVVTFELPTFETREIQRPVKNGIALLDCLARQAFLLKARVEGVELELDIAKLPSLPAEFVARTS